jgi:hypothetical protein
VDGNDLDVWESGFGTTNGANLSTGDSDNDGDVDGNDFLNWQLDFDGSSTPVPNPDFNSDGNVDWIDLGIWESGFGTTNSANLSTSDSDSDGDVDGNDFLIWQQNYGSVTGSGSATVLPEQARAKRERHVDRVFDELATRSKINREEPVDVGDSLDDLLSEKLRSDRQHFTAVAANSVVHRGSR